MRKWRGILLVLPLLIASIATAAEGLDNAARELARRIPAALHGPVSLAVRNLSDLPAAETASARRVLESELRGRGVALGEAPGESEIRVTLSQDVDGYLLVGELRRGEEKQVILVPWTRSASAANPAAGAITLVKSLLATQTEPILDAVVIEGGLLLLERGRVARLGLENGHWMSKESAAFTPGPDTAPLPRDLRGKLVVQGGAYLAYLPGAICSGAISPLEARCRASDEPWPLLHDPPLRAALARGRDYFDGHINAYGVAKSVPPFYSAAVVDDAPARLWMFTRLDGRAWLHDASLEPLAPLPSSPAWGSDIAAITAKCAGGTLVLASAAGAEKDTVRVYQIADRQAVEKAPALDFPGPITALWPITETSAAPGSADAAAIAVSRLSSGEYAVYSLAINCSH